MAYKDEPKAKEVHITRVPEKTYKEFMTIAYEECAGDYGMALKHLVESEKVFRVLLMSMGGIPPEESDEIQEEKEDNSITTLSGRRIEK